jgi:ankyrin repeat-rich membrane spanning protein
MARTLLEKGADPNIAGYYHATPLIWAAGRGHADVAQVLLTHGAKPNVPDKVNQSRILL